MSPGNDPHGASYDSRAWSPRSVARTLRQQLMAAKRPTDTRSVMVRDLRNLLDGWEYEPGKISVRKIIGRDQREKIQARIDLGVMQFESIGRPDGQRPHGAESLKDYHESRLARHIEEHGSDENFTLAPEECRDIRHEAYLYHQRYVAFFVLEEYDSVERDTAHTLRLIEGCARYAAEPSDRDALESYRNYVTMMNTRARAFQAFQRGEHQKSLDIIDAGLEDLEEPGAELPSESSGEVDLLLEMRREIIEKMPDNSPPKLEAQLQAALEHEDYEAAAKLRDRILRLRPEGRMSA